MFTASTDYWIDNWRIVVSVLAFGLVMCVVNSILLVTISAYLQRIVPITITWASLFLLLGRLGDYLFRETEDEYWRLLDPWRDMRLVGRLCFGTFPPRDRPRAGLVGLGDPERRCARSRSRPWCAACAPSTSSSKLLRESRVESAALATSDRDIRGAKR